MIRQHRSIVAGSAIFMSLWRVAINFVFAFQLAFCCISLCFPPLYSSSIAFAMSCVLWPSGRQRMMRTLERLDSGLRESLNAPESASTSERLI